MRLPLLPKMGNHQPAFWPRSVLRRPDRRGWKIIAREQREKMVHSRFAGEHHEDEKADPRGHGFAPAEQDRHFHMAEAIRDCAILLARGIGSGAYYSMEQVGIKPIVADIASVEEAALQAAQGVIMDHKEKLH